MNKRILTTAFVLFASLLILVGCRKRDAILPENYANFETNAIGFMADEATELIKVKLVRPVNSETPVSIKATEINVTYGEEYTTVPAMVNGMIEVKVPSGSQEATIEIKKVDGQIFDGDEKLEWEIYSSGSDASPVFIGATKKITISFGEMISESAVAILNGGGASYSNKVFLDFSSNRQTAVARTSWHLGFYNGNEAKVILNEAFVAKAWKLNKTDITTPISTADTTGSGLDFGSFSTPLSAIDGIDGNLNATVFGTLTTNEAESKVVICSFGGESDPNKWYRVKVTATANGYKVQYALYNDAAAAVKTVTLTKNPNYTQSFLSLSAGTTVNVEPAADAWDIAWSFSTYSAGTIAYTFQDFVLLNYLGGAKVGEVVSTVVNMETAFNNFNESNIAGVTFNSTRDAIGSGWRTTSGANLGIKRDRFYVLEDANGNVYKFKFLRMGVGDTGERGRPEIEYRLVKKA